MKLQSGRKIAAHAGFLGIIYLYTGSEHVWGAVRKNIISDRFSTKTAISAHI